MSKTPNVSGHAIQYHQQPASYAAAFIAQSILLQLRSGKSVLWLLSGGSGGDVCVQTSHILQGNDLSQLYVTMSDERYGPFGHKDENFTQLLSAGLTLDGAVVYPVLTGDSLDTTTRNFTSWLSLATMATDYKIVTLGLGSDGHTSGVKPHSAAVSSPKPAISFEGDDFTRITTTLSYLRTFDEAIVQAYGPSKHAIVRQLMTQRSDVADNPMFVTHDIPNVTLFSDLKKEEI